MRNYFLYPHDRSYIVKERVQKTCLSREPFFGPEGNHLAQEVNPILVQLRHSHAQSLRPPLRELHFEVLERRYPRPGRLIWSPQRAEYLEQLVNL